MSILYRAIFSDHRTKLLAECRGEFVECAVFEITDDEVRVVRCPDGEVMRAVPRRR
jgi:hypothetical protein